MLRRLPGVDSEIAPHIGQERGIRRERWRCDGSSKRQLQTAHDGEFPALTADIKYGNGRAGLRSGIGQSLNAGQRSQCSRRDAAELNPRGFGERLKRRQLRLLQRNHKRLAFAGFPIRRLIIDDCIIGFREFLDSLKANNRRLFVQWNGREADFLEYEAVTTDSHQKGGGGDLRVSQLVFEALTDCFGVRRSRRLRFGPGEDALSVGAGFADLRRQHNELAAIPIESQISSHNAPIAFISRVVSNATKCYF